ncbi:rod shape-determining protein MreC [Sphingomonas sp. PL-96]|uniref:rod shape-determining protein MreC n=1 Tax=Sphingomonas sp. PL-96 TaxID=2887201 RepID=UPI001E33977A|nr:rod shape-determining protein MreC [Sphingomonas sp. PL-96]MCC2976490.1 rod shape-determining protein MreC [Sphingomonas sp. PL-96]
MAPQRDRRPGFSRRAQYGVFLGYVAAAAGALIAAALLLLSTFNPPAFAAMRGVLREGTAPVSLGLRNVRDFLASGPAAVAEHFRVKHENRLLRAQVQRDAALVQRARMLVRENGRLRRLLQVQELPTQTVAAARLVSSSASSTRRYAVLAAGYGQGVRSGQPVRGPEGLLGRIVETSANTARVVLLTDPDSVIPVRRTRDGLPAIASGRGDGLVDVRSANVANAPFLAGDIFVTSGIGGIYPPNIPVARVLQNARDTAPARAFARPDRADFALVLQTFLPPPPPPAAVPTPAPTASAPTTAPQ